VAGKLQDEGKKQFSDGRTGNFYVLHPKEKRSIVVGQNTLPLLPMKRDHLKPEDILGETVVNGVQCTGLRVQMNGTTVPGVSWTSIPYDLVVKTEYQFSGHRHVIELYDIQSHLEPDPSVFTVPEDYAVETRLVQAHQ
jgi:hypothetical protein